MPDPSIVIPKFYLEVDKTGINLSNKITAERHILPDTLFRIIAPYFGAYYANSLQVYSIDTATNVPILLVRDVDYQCVEIADKDTLKNGLEICHVILITHTTPNLTYDIVYQALGGSTSPSVPLLLSAIESLNIGHHAQSWKDVTHKPYGYNPTHHLHDSKDVYGFEFIRDTLGRLKQAIDDSSYETIHKYLINHLKKRLDDLSIPLANIVNNNLDNLSILTNAAERTLLNTYKQLIETNKSVDELVVAAMRLTQINNDYVNTNYDGIYSNLLTALCKKQSKQNLLILDVPRRIEDLELWLDANDNAMTITNIPNQIIWKDKSPYAREYIAVGDSRPAFIASSSGIRSNSFVMTTGKYFNKSKGSDFVLDTNMTIICITAKAQISSDYAVVLFSNNDGSSVLGNTNASRTFSIGSNDIVSNTSDNDTSFPRISTLALGEDFVNSYTSTINLTNNTKVVSAISPVFTLDNVKQTLNRIGSLDKNQSGEINSILVYKRRLATCEIECIIEYFYRRNKL